MDVVWTLGIGAITSYGFISTYSGDWRQILIYACILFWSLRLGSHLIQRIKNYGDDHRYLNLKDKWGGKASSNMFGVFQLQAFWCTVFASLPFMAISTIKPFQVYDLIGFAIFAFAFLGEAIADRQLHHFKKNQSNEVVCNEGLWAWSRHPNYFFEWLHWWSYVFFCIGTGFTFIGVLITCFMLYLICKVTGIPPTEERLLQSKKEAYRRYQENTSVFFPRPP